MPLPAVNHAAPSVVGLTPEVITVSALLSMPAVWTAVVERELPAGILLERFLIVLLTCAMLTELIRRLGEGGALGPAPLDDDIRNSTASRTAATATSPYDARVDYDDFGGGFQEYDAPLALDGSSPLDAPSTGDLDPLGDLDAGLADFGSMDDLGELAPLDLNADPFADPV